MADADLTYDFGEIPRFVDELRGGRPAGDGRPHGQHPARRDAVAAPLHRQPDPDGAPQPLLPHRGPRRPLRHARAAPRRAAARSTCARPAWSSPRRWSSAPPRRTSRSPRSPIEYHPRGGESKLSSFRDGWRHLRFLLVHSPTHLFIVPGHACCAGSARSSSVDGARAARRLRPQLGPPHPDRRRAADDRRHAGARRWGSAPTPTAPTSWARRTPGSTAMRARFRLEHGLALGGAITLAGLVAGAS